MFILFYLLFPSVTLSVTPGWRLMRVQRDIWLVCTCNWLTRFITNSEVGFKFSEHTCILFFVCVVTTFYTLCIQSTLMFQIACCLGREELCGCVWCSTVRAAPPLAHPSTCCTCTTHTSAACPGSICILTPSSWSNSSMWETLWHQTPDLKLLS